MRDAHTRWTVVALLAGAILVASIVPIPGPVPEAGSGIPTTLLCHAVGYAALALAVGHAVLPAVRRPWALVAGVCGAIAYGALIECVQYPLTYRTFSYLDMLVNGAGAIVGAVVLLGALVPSEHRR